ncbi:hypothetical protein C8Q80DRAFT_1194313 [Daedaleopsis nitida]|nr:hypothetical protein C8Q80DRAFT_1194313 [Daedaleopsis nitida]
MKAEIEGRFKKWEPNARGILQQMQEPAQEWVVNVCNELATYTEENVVLVGDAAHAMVPSQGAGVG